MVDRALNVTARAGDVDWLLWNGTAPRTSVGIAGNLHVQLFTAGDVKHCVSARYILPAPPAPEADMERICAKCGKVIKNAAYFCRECQVRVAWDHTRTVVGVHAVGEP